MPSKRTAKQSALPVKGKENVDPVTLTRKLHQSREKRKAQRRNELQAKFNEDMASGEQRMKELLESAAEESSTQRANFSSRLMELFQKRGEIETQIIVHSRVLEEAYIAAYNEFKEVLKGKMEEVDEGPKPLRHDRVEETHEG